MKVTFRVIAAIASAVGIQELALIAGLGLLGYGAGLAFAPAGFFVPGAVLVYIAIAGMN